jgi:hypothetical protein
MDLAASHDHVRRCLEQFERRTASALRVLTGQPPSTAVAHSPRFVDDSPLEGSGFEPSVPRERV